MVFVEFQIIDQGTGMSMVDLGYMQTMAEIEQKHS